MEFGRFLGVMRRMESMSCGDLRVVRAFFMAASFVMLRRFPMVFRCEIVMFSRCLVMFCTFVSRHCSILLLAGIAIPHMLLPIAYQRTPGEQIADR
jgi:hypothetical protein